jgi:hypothetical protein
VQVTPIANLDNVNSEWVLDTSWTTSTPTPSTLAELIHDLTQETNAPASELTAPATESQITLSSLFEVDLAEAAAATSPLEHDPAAQILDIPEILDLESRIPPIEQIEIQSTELNPSLSPDLTLSNWFEASPFEASPDVAPESEPAATELVIELETPEANLAASELEFRPTVEPDRELDLPAPISLDAAPTETQAETGLDTVILAQLDQLLAEPTEPTVQLAESTESTEQLAVPPDATHPETDTQSDPWFLGIDIGTTGISAVLLNQTQCQLYPLYWQSVNDTANDDSANNEVNFETHPAKQQFRLSTTVTLATANPTASAQPTIRLEPAPPNAPRLRLGDWKPYLKLTVPHHSPQTSQWEPVLQWSEGQSVPLRTLQEALQQLLTTLRPAHASFMPSLTCQALGMAADRLDSILPKLAGIVVGYPSNWSDTYSFNLREAILQAELVTHPDQIVFVEEAIASLLSALPAADGRLVSLAIPQEQSGHLHNANWQGTTLILTAGASLTELVLVNLPLQLEQLNPTDFYVRSVLYAGLGIDQDVFSQLLYPALLRLDAAAPTENPAGSPKIDFVIDPIDFNQLGLADLTLPSAAELDFSKRYRLQQVLLSSQAGQQLLTAAQFLKITLQHQPRFTLRFGTQQFTIERQDLTSRVLLPYVQRLNRELNTLLAQTNTTAAAIARWLQQKLPNATIIQDTYPRAAAMQDSALSNGLSSCIPSCSRVAYGLATVPLHPQIIDRSRHQYSDYFLLKELLQTVPAQPTPIETIMQFLEQRGIDTPTCRFRILALLDGHLPPGLVPADPDLALLTLESAINPDYQAIQFAPVFAKQADRTYQLNQPQRDYLQQYLETLLADTEQTLAQPLEFILSRVES